MKKRIAFIPSNGEFIVQDHFLERILPFFQNNKFQTFIILISKNNEHPSLKLVDHVVVPEVSVFNASKPNLR